MVFNQPEVSRMKRIICLVLLLFSLVPQSIVGAAMPVTNAKTKKEILNLKQKISTNLSNNIYLNERYYKHELAIQQVKLLELTTEDLILKYHPRTRYKRQINQFVENSFECSFIFKTLGNDHLQIFEMYQRWAEAETGFDPMQISVWKKGQRIKKFILNRRGNLVKEEYYIIKFSSKDAGILQVNNRNLQYVKKHVMNLYKDGIIPFKVKEIRNLNDLLDVNTNLVARSIIETDRKERGWGYKHYTYNSMKFYYKLRLKINNLKAAGLYDPELVQKYYNLNPIKTYEEN